MSWKGVGRAATEPQASLATSRGCEPLEAQVTMGIMWRLDCGT